MFLFLRREAVMHWAGTIAAPNILVPDKYFAEVYSPAWSRSRDRQDHWLYNIQHAQVSETAVSASYSEVNTQITKEN